MKNKMKNVGAIICLGVGLSLGILAVGCTGDRYHQSTGEVIDDAAVTSKVKAELLKDPDVKGLAVKVKTYKGKVQLSGFVDTQGQKQRAGEIARGVKGAQWIENNISVK